MAYSDSNEMRNRSSNLKSNGFVDIVSSSVVFGIIAAIIAYFLGYSIIDSFVIAAIVTFSFVLLHITIKLFWLLLIIFFAILAYRKFLK